MKYRVLGVKQFQTDETRVDRTSLFYKKYFDAVDEVEKFKNTNMQAVDFISIQAHDGAIGHNEATASFALALFRYLTSISQEERLCRISSQELEALAEEDVIILALLHDLGKHAIDLDLLNNPDLSAEELEQLRSDLYRETNLVFTELNYGSYSAALENLYHFKRTQELRNEDDLLTLVVSAANLYDTLTSPKLYKGDPWTISGALEELLRSPHIMNENCAVYRAFVELMKPENMIVKETGPETLFR